MATVQRTLQRSELRILAILGVPTFALALGDHDGLDLPARPGRGLLGLHDRHRPAHRRRGAHRAVAAAGRRRRGRTGCARRSAAGCRSSSPRRRRSCCRSRVLGFVTTIAGAAVVVAVFFVGYFVAYEPYRALYPDLVDDAIAGRAQSTQAIFRGAATFLALVAGGLLISIADPLPFVAAAVIVAASWALCVAGGRYRRRGGPTRRRRSPRSSARSGPTGRRGTARSRPTSSPTRSGSCRWRPEDVRRALRDPTPRVRWQSPSLTSGSGRPSCSSARSSAASSRPPRAAPA